MTEQRVTPQPSRVLVRVFERAGFRVMRQRGDHIIMTRPGVRRPLVIKAATRAVPVMNILTNLRTAGIGREEYLRLLDEVR